MHLKSKMLVFSIEAPKLNGIGGEIRVYHFLQALSRRFEISLVVLYPGDDRTPDERVYEMCSDVLLASDAIKADRKTTESVSRISLWVTAFKALLSPWRNHWRSFMRYCMQFQCASGKVRVTDEDKKPSRRFLGKAFTLEFAFFTRWFRPPPILAFYYLQPYHDIRHSINKLIKGNTFDYIWFEHSFMYPYIRSCLTGSQARIICNTHNIEYVLHRRHAEAAATLRERHYWRNQSRLMKKLETETFHAADVIIVCSENDKGSAEAISPTSRYLVVGNGVNTNLYNPPKHLKKSDVPCILFTGTMGYAPNIDSVGYFLEQIFPLVLKYFPTSRFIVAGHRAEECLRSAGLAHEQMRSITSPDSMVPIFSKAWVFVVPLRIGGGTRLKILEAMAMEIPVVSTSIGAEGVPYKDGEHLFLADTPADFANAINRLLSDVTLRETIGWQGAQFARKHYDWNRLCSLAVDSLFADRP